MFDLNEHYKKVVQIQANAFLKLERELYELKKANIKRCCLPIITNDNLPGTDCPAWLCPLCGDLFEEGANYCSNCGAKVVHNG